MPAWLKIILIIFGIFALVVVGLAVTGYYWMQKHGGELKAAAQKLESDGEAFGRGRDENACVDETLRRLRGDTGFTSQVRMQIFFTGCRKTATPSPELCAGVPPEGEVLETAKWSLAQCGKRGFEGSRPCAQVMNVVASGCQKASK